MEMYGGIIHTDRSPIFGVSSYLECSEICQNQANCLHWQWKENGGECSSVEIFDSFIRSEERVLAGARSCPLTSQSLLSMCPTSGDNTDMWQATSFENNASYDPEIKLGKYLHKKLCKENLL